MSFAAIIVLIIVVIAVVALLIYAVDLIGVDRPFNRILKALIVILGVVIIVEKAGLL